MKTIAGAGRIWKLYHSVGSLDVFDLEVRSARVRLTYPYLDLSFCRMTTGMFIASLEQSSAQSVRVAHEKCVAKGDRYCQYHVTWK